MSNDDDLLDLALSQAKRVEREARILKRLIAQVRETETPTYSPQEAQGEQRQASSVEEER